MTEDSLRFEPVSWENFETGMEGEFFAAEGSHGMSLAGAIGGGIRTRGVVAGVCVNQTFMKDEGIPSRSVVMGRLGIDF